MNKVRTLTITLLTALGLAALAASTAAASTPPTVVTKAAAHVKLTATLNGTVNPNGSEVTECKFEYGSTTAYGSSVPCATSPGSGTSPVEVSASLTGLVQNSLYHFRVSATSSEGTSVGKDLFFATPAQLPEWGQCVVAANHEGRFGDAGCTEPTSKVYGRYPGAYEWYPHEVSPEVGSGEATLQDRIGSIEQPVSSTTITLANGDTITCEALSETTVVEITGPHTTLGAPRLAFDGCHPEGQQEFTCFTTDAGEPGEVTTHQEWENFREASGPTWNGTLTYFEGKRSAEPVVGYVWKTNPADQRFFQQLVCEGGPIQALLIGGHKKNEVLAMQVTPVNAMSREHTLSMSESGGVGQPASFEGHPAKPLEAEVNATGWQPIGFETTMLFPETEGVYSQAERAAGVERVGGELELKATP